MFKSTKLKLVDTSQPIKGLAVLASLFLLASCNQTHLKDQIEDKLATVAGDYAIAYKDLRSGNEILINADVEFHAASTMKTPVMMEVYRQAREGRFRMEDSIKVKNSFSSIVDGSTYTLSVEDDSEAELYQQTDSYKTISALVYDMIIVSSNLATNLIIEKVDAKNVTAYMLELGANRMRVLRGVEDIKAFEKGLSNTTTARDLMVIFEALARPTTVHPEDADAMIQILLDQRFNSVIPGKLPADIQVAHKTGSITGVQHDSGIVILPKDQGSYILVMLSKNVEDRHAAINMMADVSLMIYEHYKGSI